MAEESITKAISGPGFKWLVLVIGILLIWFTGIGDILTANPGLMIFWGIGTIIWMME